MMRENTFPAKGFTLVEMLIYIAIMGFLATGFAAFSFSISSARTKSYVISETNANLRSALGIISDRIRSADGVNVAGSVLASDPGVLSLSMRDAAKSPTVISLNADDGRLQIKEGASPPEFITSSSISIKRLIFILLSPAGERENIRIEMTADFNQSGSVEFQYGISAITAVSVRQ